jgi:hypothetical protein
MSSAARGDGMGFEGGFAALEPPLSVHERPLEKMR